MTKLTTRKSTSTRLTDTQLVVLSRAALREDGAATLPEGMTENAAQKLAAALVRRQLVSSHRHNDVASAMHFCAQTLSGADLQ
jgi:hypothetical protein